MQHLGLTRLLMNDIVKLERGKERTTRFFAGRRMTKHVLCLSFLVGPVYARLHTRIISYLMCVRAFRALHHQFGGLVHADAMDMPELVPAQGTRVNLVVCKALAQGRQGRRTSGRRCNCTRGQQSVPHWRTALGGQPLPM